MAKLSISMPDAAADLLDKVCKDIGASRSSLIQMAILTLFDENTLRSGTVRAVVNKIAARARNAAEAGE